jgi:hypothetical protein
MMATAIANSGFASTSASPSGYFFLKIVSSHFKGFPVQISAYGRVRAFRGKASSEGFAWLDF